MNLSKQQFAFVAILRRVGWASGCALIHCLCLTADAHGYTPKAQEPSSQVREGQDFNARRLESAIYKQRSALQNQASGKTREAIVDLEQALGLLEGVSQADAHISLGIRIKLSAMYLVQGRTDEARQRTQEAIASAKRLGLTEDLAKAWIVLSEIQRSTGEYDSASRSARNALKAAKPISLDDSGILEAIQNQLARIAFESSELSTAQASWSLVLEARRRRLPEEDESLLSLRVDLARIAVLKGRQKEAESELLAVVELAKRGEKHAAFSRALFVLGTLRRNQKRLEEAEQAFIQSLQLSDRSLGEGSADSALCLLELAKLSLGKRLPQEAYEFSRRAAKFSSEQGPTELVWLDLAEIHAQVLRKLGRKGDAESVAAFVTKARQEQERSRNVVDVTELIAK